MLNVLIRESDRLFRYGLTTFLTNIFREEFDCNLHFNFELTRDNVRRADIVVLSLCQGECFTCFPELYARQKGIIIGLVDDELRASASLSCFQDIIFVSRRASLLHFRRVLFTAWQKTQLPEYHLHRKSCFSCQHRTLSPQQLRIMIGLYHGLSPLQIAEQLMISDKTVFTHKYIMMQKFNLRSDCELLILLKRMVEKNILPIFFREHKDKTIKENYAADTVSC